MDFYSEPIDKSWTENAIISLQPLTPTSRIAAAAARNNSICMRASARRGQIVSIEASFERTVQRIHYLFVFYDQQFILPSFSGGTMMATSKASCWKLWVAVCFRNKCIYAFQVFSADRSLRRDLWWTLWFSNKRLLSNNKQTEEQQQCCRPKKKKQQQQKNWKTGNEIRNSQTYVKIFQCWLGPAAVWR